MSESSRKLAATLPFSRFYRTGDIPLKGISGCVEMNAGERESAARLLDIAGLNALRMDFKIRRCRPRRLKLNGHLLADVTQSCVVTLEPVECRIDEQFDIEFWPPEDIARLENHQDHNGMTIALDGPEPLHEDGIDVGQLAYEQLAAALDPYPRMPGAEFVWRDAGGEEGAPAADNPFSELSRLKTLKDAPTD